MMLKNRLIILFVYLGDVIPDYVVANANRTAELFEYEVYLAIEAEARISEKLKFSPKLSIHKIEELNFKREFALSHDQEFRNGFWMHTFDRLLAIKEIHRSLGKKTSILHVESDMLIMSSFPFEEFLHDKTKWFNHDLYGDVASLVFLPNLSETEWLYEQLIQEAKIDPLVTDMSALKRIRNRFPESIQTLPDVFSTLHEEDSRDMFDGLALGMWLCGVDSRNTYGFQFLHENSVFAPDGSITLKEALCGAHFYLNDNNTLFLRRLGKEIQVHSLHIHSKDQELFAIDNRARLERYVQMAMKQEPQVMKFNYDTFKNLMVQNLVAGKFSSYIRHLAKFFLKGIGSKQSRLWVCFVYMIRRDRQ